MEIENTLFEDVKIIKTKKMKDNRGSFTKIFSEEIFNSLGINTSIKEEFFSISNKNVIRGMHFQIPPFAHDKIVFVLNGEIEDLILDIRKESKTYGKYIKLILKENDENIVYIPKGFAHGFKSLSDNSIVVYMTSKEYSKEHDKGILWNSFGYDWKKVKDPIISERDSNFVKLEDFNSPF